MLDKVVVKQKQFLDSDNEKDVQDWKIISNHFDNLIHLRVTACEVPKIGVQVRHETVQKAQTEEQKDYYLTPVSFFIRGAQLVPLYNADGTKIVCYKIGAIDNMKL